MSPVETGRHCFNCQQLVTDFTRMTDAQLLDYFKKYPGPGCGRYREDQLNRTIKEVEVLKSKKWARIAAGLLFTSLLSREASGQTSGKSPGVQAQNQGASFKPG